jgi:hypothetical protein
MGNWDCIYFIIQKTFKPQIPQFPKKLNPNLEPNFSRATTLKDDEFAKFFGLASTDTHLNTTNPAKETPEK